MFIKRSTLILIICILCHVNTLKLFIGECGYGFCHQGCKKVQTDIMRCYCYRGYSLKADGRKCERAPDDTVYSGDFSGDDEDNNCDDEAGDCGDNQSIISGDGEDIETTEIIATSRITEIEKHHKKSTFTTPILFTNFVDKPEINTRLIKSSDSFVNIPKSILIIPSSSKKSILEYTKSTKQSIDISKSKSVNPSSLYINVNIKPSVTSTLLLLPINNSFINGAVSSKSKSVLLSSSTSTIIDIDKAYTSIGNYIQSSSEAFDIIKQSSKSIPLETSSTSKQLLLPSSDTMKNIHISSAGIPLLSTSVVDSKSKIVDFKKSRDLASSSSMAILLSSVDDKGITIEGDVKSSTVMIRFSTRKDSFPSTTTLYDQTAPSISIQQSSATLVPLDHRMLASQDKQTISKISSEQSKSSKTVLTTSLVVDHIEDASTSQIISISKVMLADVSKIQTVDSTRVKDTIMNLVTPSKSLLRKSTKGVLKIISKDSQRITTSAKPSKSMKAKITEETPLRKIASTSTIIVSPSPSFMGKVVSTTATLVKTPSLQNERNTQTTFKTKTKPSVVINNESKTIKTQTTGGLSIEIKASKSKTSDYTVVVIDTGKTGGKDSGSILLTPINPMLIIVLVFQIFYVFL